MNQRFDVIVVGELNVDLILNQMGSLPVLGREILAEQMTITMGSSSAIFASNLATLGDTVSFAGKIGRDKFGDMVLSDLKRKGIHTGHILTTDEVSTGVTVALNYGNERSMITYPGAIHSLTVRDIRFDMLHSARHLHISSIFLQKGLRKDIISILKRARSLGLTTSVDPQWDPEERWDIDLGELMTYTDVFLPNLSEWKALTGLDDTGESLRYTRNFDNIIAIKNGIQGACLWNGHLLIRQPAYLNQKVVDCIGAGDSFDAGYIHKFLRGKSPEECLEFAALMGAVNTTARGGTNAFQNLDAIKTIASTAFNYQF